jgi:hypothetical protein
MPRVVGLVFELARGLAMMLGCVGVAEHVGGLGRLTLAARGSLVSRGGPIVRSALRGALILLLRPHIEQASALLAHGGDIAVASALRRNRRVRAAA